MENSNKETKTNREISGGILLSMQNIMNACIILFSFRMSQQLFSYSLIQITCCIVLRIVEANSAPHLNILE